MELNIPPVRYQAGCGISYIAHHSVRSTNDNTDTFLFPNIVPVGIGYAPFNLLA
jgi:hypothetical protein